MNTIRIRLGHESLDVTLAHLKGKDAESEEAQESEQQQPGAVRMIGCSIQNHHGGDRWLTKPRSPVFVLKPKVRVLPAIQEESPH